MGHGVSAGWVLGVTLAGAISLLACGGNSENQGRDEGSSDDDFGGSSASGSGGASNGGTSSGGSISNGGISQGGSVAAGGTGGAPTCSECPAMGYGLVIDGDGPTYTMAYNGFIDGGADRAPLSCGESPVRGATGGCGRTIQLSACEGATNSPPCLEIGLTGVSYVSRSGVLFTGTLTTDTPTPSIPGVESGTATIELASAAGEMLTLTVSYTFCAPLGNLRIPC
jgi:hypothetical protein